MIKGKTDEERKQLVLNTIKKHLDKENKISKTHMLRLTHLHSYQIDSILNELQEEGEIVIIKFESFNLETQKKVVQSYDIHYVGGKKK